MDDIFSVVVKYLPFRVTSKLSKTLMLETLPKDITIKNLKQYDRFIAIEKFFDFSKISRLHIYLHNEDNVTIGLYFDYPNKQTNTVSFIVPISDSTNEISTKDILFGVNLDSVLVKIKYDKFKYNCFMIGCIILYFGCNMLYYWLGYKLNQSLILIDTFISLILTLFIVVKYNYTDKYYNISNHNYSKHKFKEYHIYINNLAYTINSFLEYDDSQPGTHIYTYTPETNIV